MSEAEFSASEEGLFVAESSNQSSSPSKPSRGTSKRGRGRPKRTRKVSSDNDSSSNGLHVSSLKHVGKFRYLSNLTQTENAEVDLAKPVASRGKRGNGRGRGRGRGSSNHMTSSVNSAAESSSHVSRSGRRIKPNNRWAPDADFDPGPTKVLPGRVSQRKNAVKGVKTISEEISLPELPLKTVESDDNNAEDEIVSTSKDVVQLEESVCADRQPEESNGIKENNAEEDNRSASPHCSTETSELNPQIFVVEKEVSEEVEVESSVIIAEVDEVSNTAIPVVIDDQELTIGVDGVVVPSSEITVELVSTTSELVEGECSPNQASEDCSPVEDYSVQSELSSALECSSQVDVSRTTDNCHSEVAAELPTPNCSKELVNHVDTSDSTGSEREDSSQSLASKDNATEQLYNSSAGNTPKADDEAFDTQSVLISPKPVKVKSRWRRTSELEQVVVRNGYSDQSSCNNSPLSMSPKTSCSLPPFVDQRDNHNEEKNRMTDNASIIEERLKSFEIVEENQYLTSRNTSKEVKRMLCDCTLSKEEIARGELGCGEDCINRLLMIEW